MWISSWSCPKGRGCPASRYDLTSAVRVSNSQPSISILRMSIWVWPAMTHRGSQNFAGWNEQDGCAHHSSSWGCQACTLAGCLVGRAYLNQPIQMHGNVCGAPSISGSEGQKIWPWSRSPRFGSVGCWLRSQPQRTTRNWCLDLQSNGKLVCERRTRVGQDSHQRNRLCNLVSVGHETTRRPIYHHLRALLPAGPREGSCMPLGNSPLRNGERKKFRDPMIQARIKS